MAKRPRSHFITGLGDGNVDRADTHNHDDLFYRRSKERREAAALHNKPNIRGRSFTMDVSPNADGIASLTPSAISSIQNSWQYSVWALIAIMGLLVALFLHLVTDNAPNNNNNKSSKKPSSHQKRKKKTDEWSDNDFESEYSDWGDTNEEIYSYSTTNKETPQYPKHRRTSRSQQNAFYFSAEHPSLSASATTSSNNYRSPSNSYNTSNSFSHTQRQQDASPNLGTPIRKIDFQHARNTLTGKPLSPVSSFASLGESGHQEQSELPLPPGVTRGSKSKQGVLEDELETPRAGVNRSVISASVPQPPNLEIEQGTPQQAKTPIIPFMPNLNPPQSVSIEDLHSQMESGSLPYRSDFSQSDSQLAFAPRKNTTQQPRTISSDENDPRRNIHHKRKDLTQSTDTASSLLSSIQFEELQLEEVIGGGGFGQVWKATWRSCPVAVKVLTGSAQREHVSKSILQEFSGEIEMLKGMRHPNICLYMGACLDPPYRAIVTELAVNGSVWDALRLPLQPPYNVTDGVTRIGWPVSLYNNNSPSSKLPPQGRWPWLLVKRVASGAARAMCFLHSGNPPVLHRDLKSANLLLDESYTTKVCDFGLSRLKAQERSMTGNWYVFKY